MEHIEEEVNDFSSWESMLWMMRLRGSYDITSCHYSERVNGFRSGISGWCACVIYSREKVVKRFRSAPLDNSCSDQRFCDPETKCFSLKCPVNLTQQTRFSLLSRPMRNTLTRMNWAAKNISHGDKCSVFITCDPFIINSFCTYKVHVVHLTYFILQHRNCSMMRRTMGNIYILYIQVDTWWSRGHLRDIYI